MNPVIRTLSLLFPVILIACTTDPESPMPSQGSNHVLRAPNLDPATYSDGVLTINWKHFTSTNLPLMAYRATVLPAGDTCLVDADNEALPGVPVSCEISLESPSMITNVVYEVSALYQDSGYGPARRDSITIYPQPMWTPQTSSTNRTLHAVASNQDMLVAVGDTGVILTSTNGVSWTVRQSGTSQSLRAVAWTGDRFLAAGDSGTLLTSADAVTWTSLVSGTTRTLRAIAGSNGKSVIVGDARTVLVSTDSAGWEADNIEMTELFWSPSTYPFYSAVWTGTRFVIGGEAGVLFQSSDGATWEPIAQPQHYMAPLIDAWFGLAWDGDGVVAVGRWGVCDRRISGNCMEYRYYGSSTRLAEGSNQFSGYRVSYDARDGLRSIAWNGTSFLAVGNGSQAVSPDGMHWVGRNNVPEHNSVTWSGQQWVAVGVGGIIHTSP